MMITWKYLTNIFQKLVQQIHRKYAIAETPAVANDMSKHRAHTTKYEDLCM